MKKIIYLSAVFAVTLLCLHCDILGLVDYGSFADEQNKKSDGGQYLIQTVFVAKNETSFNMSDGTNWQDVYLSRSLYVGKYEITYREWVIVRDWAQTRGYNFSAIGTMGKDGTNDLNPVTTIGFYNMLAWCNALSEMEGFRPVYYMDKYKTVVYKDAVTYTGYYDVSNDSVDWNAGGFRLPTEAEWEYIAGSRGVTDPVKHSGSDIWPNAVDCGWCSENSGNITHAAGLKKPNSLGLYDMSGNASEAVWNRYPSNYVNSVITDPHGDGYGTRNRERGGAYLTSAVNLRVDRRNSQNWNEAVNYMGFRVVRNAD